VESTSELENEIWPQKDTTNNCKWKLLVMSFWGQISCSQWERLNIFRSKFQISNFKIVEHEIWPQVCNGGLGFRP
jgi:hypothetical protein